MRCPNCRSEYSAEDVYCRSCGADVAVPSTDLVVTPANLPAVIANSPISRSVAAGVGALVLGVGLEFLRRSVLARLTQSASRIDASLPLFSGVRETLLPQRRRWFQPVGDYHIDEIVVYRRRIIRRDS